MSNVIMHHSDSSQVIKDVSEGLSFPDSPDFDRALDTLRDISPENLFEIFARLLDDPTPELALGAATAAGLLGNCALTAILTGLVDEPGKWFSHEDRDAIQLAAVQSLGLLRDPAAIDSLLFIIDHPRNSEIAMQAILAVGNIGSPDSAISLLDRMFANPPIALSAAGALVQIGGEDVFMGFLKGIRHDDEIIVSASVWALGKLGDTRAIIPLTSLIRDSDPFLRRDIAWSLGQIGGVNARLILCALMRNDTDHGVRCEAAKTVKNGAVLGAERVVLTE